MSDVVSLNTILQQKGLRKAVINSLQEKLPNGLFVWEEVWNTLPSQNQFKKETFQVVPQVEPDMYTFIEQLEKVKFSITELRNTFIKNNFQGAVNKIDKHYGAKQQQSTMITPSTTVSAPIPTPITTPTTDAQRLSISRLKNWDGTFDENLISQVVVALQYKSQLTTFSAYTIWYSIMYSFLKHQPLPNECQNNGVFDFMNFVDTLSFKGYTLANLVNDLNKHGKRDVAMELSQAI